MVLRALAGHGKFLVVMIAVVRFCYDKTDSISFSLLL